MSIIFPMLRERCIRFGTLVTLVLSIASLILLTGCQRQSAEPIQSSGATVQQHTTAFQQSTKSSHNGMLEPCTPEKVFSNIASYQYIGNKDFAAEVNRSLCDQVQRDAPGVAHLVLNSLGTDRIRFRQAIEILVFKPPTAELSEVRVRFLEALKEQLQASRNIHTITQFLEICEDGYGSEATPAKEIVTFYLSSDDETIRKKAFLATIRMVQFSDDEVRHHKAVTYFVRGLRDPSPSVRKAVASSFYSESRCYPEIVLDEGRERRPRFLNFKMDLERALQSADTQTAAATAMYQLGLCDSLDLERHFTADRTVGLAFLNAEANFHLGILRRQVSDLSIHGENLRAFKTFEPVLKKMVSDCSELCQDALLPLIVLSSDKQSAGQIIWSSFNSETLELRLSAAKACSKCDESPDELCRHIFDVLDKEKDESVRSTLLAVLNESGDQVSDEGVMAKAVECVMSVSNEAYYLLNSLAWKRGRTESVINRLALAIESDETFEIFFEECRKCVEEDIEGDRKAQESNKKYDEAIRKSEEKISNRRQEIRKRYKDSPVSDNMLFETVNDAELRGLEQQLSIALQFPPSRSHLLPREVRIPDDSSTSYFFRIFEASGDRGCMKTWTESQKEALNRALALRYWRSSTTLGFGSAIRMIAAIKPEHPFSVEGVIGGYKLAGKNHAVDDIVAGLWQFNVQDKCTLEVEYIDGRHTSISATKWWEQQREEQQNRDNPFKRHGDSKSTNLLTGKMPPLDQTEQAAKVKRVYVTCSLREKVLLSEF